MRTHGPTRGGRRPEQLVQQELAARGSAGVCLAYVPTTGAGGWGQTRASWDCWKILPAERLKTLQIAVRTACRLESVTGTPDERFSNRNKREDR